MDQKAAQEFILSQSHEQFVDALSRIAPTEGDVTMEDIDQPGVGDESPNHSATTYKWKSLTDGLAEGV